MARIALVLPKVGLVMENARLVRWLKQVGDEVRLGEPLLELETEKSLVEIEATASGRLLELLLRENDEAHVGDRIAWLEAAAGPPAGAAAAGAAPGSAAPDRSVSTQGADPAPATVSASALPPVRAAPVPTQGGRLRSSPAARRLAAESRVDLRALRGSGPGGRIQLADVRRAVGSSHRRATAPSDHAPAAAALAPMRRALARTMTLSNATVPQFAVESALDLTVLQAVRTRLLATLPSGAARPSVNDFLLQAIARTLLELPALNATFTGEVDAPDARIVPARGAHIGLVVAVTDGLRVPVLHDVQELSICELAAAREDLVRRTLAGRLRREELEGGTFSLSNLGARGPDRFNALINPPQSAILAVGRQRDQVVAVPGGIGVRPLSQLTLTVDHRIADGRLAADFLAALIGILQGEAWHLR